MENSTFTHSEANDILVSIIKNISLGIIAFDFYGYITISNELARKNLALAESLAEINNKNILDCLSSKNILRKKIENCIKKSRKPFKFESLEYANKYLRITGNPIVNGMILTLEDVTAKEESERAMLKFLIKGQEDERKRIAKELHDGFGPMLSAIKLNMEAVQSDLGSLKKETINRLENTYNLIDGAANDLRSLSHDLMPKIVEDFGLVEALDNLSKTYTTKKSHIEFTHNMSNERYNKTLELNLYRIAQELTHNALKYSGASKISLQLLKHKNSLILMVEDNGNGFSQKDIKDYGIGLKNIDTRVRSMGGAFFIDSVPSIGVIATTEIAISL